MHTRSLFLVPFLLAACSGEAFRAAPPSGEPDAGGWQRRPHPERADVSAPPVALLAAHADGGVLAFSSDGGSEQARAALNGPVLDLSWDAARRRALVARGEADVDGSRIGAIGYDGAGFDALGGESEPFEGQVRLWHNAAGALVMTEGPAASWTLLDATLSPVGLPKALLAPAGLSDDAPDDAQGWIALDGFAFDGQAHADALLTVKATPKWSFTRLLVPAPERPTSRLAHARGTDELYLVRKHADQSALAVGRTTVTQPGVPDFVAAQGADALGELVEVVVVPERDALIALVAPPGAEHTRVVRVPVAGGTTSAVDAPGTVQVSAWFGRHAAAVGDGRVVIATSAGAFAVQVSAAELSLESGFSQPAARPPLVALTDT